MRLILHERAFTEASEALRAGRHVLVGARAGLGRTRLATAVSAAHAAETGRRLIRVAVPRDPAPDVLARLLPAERRRDGGADDLVDALAAWLGGAVLVLAGGAALLGVRRWGGLTSRYDAPTEETSTSGRATDEESDWDRLSRGDDPTVS